MQNQKLLQVLEYIANRVNKAADSTGQKLEEFIQNEDALRPILMTAHSRLPVFIRMVVGEERFVAFVLENKEKLLIQRHISQIVAEIVNKLLKR